MQKRRSFQAVGDSIFVCMGFMMVYVSWVSAVQLIGQPRYLGQRHPSTFRVPWMFPGNGATWRFPAVSDCRNCSAIWMPGVCRLTATSWKRKKLLTKQRENWVVTCIGWSSTPMWSMCSIVVEKQVGLGFLIFGQMLAHMAPQLMLHPEIWLQKWVGLCPLRHVGHSQAISTVWETFKKWRHLIKAYTGEFVGVCLGMMHLHGALTDTFQNRTEAWRIHGCWRPWTLSSLATLAPNPTEKNHWSGSTIWIIEQRGENKSHCHILQIDP